MKYAFVSSNALFGYGAQCKIPYWLDLLHELFVRTMEKSGARAVIKFLILQGKNTYRNAFGDGTSVLKILPFIFFGNNWCRWFK